jgi:uncharacterized membrane protein YccC
MAQHQQADSTQPELVLENWVLTASWSQRLSPSWCGGRAIRAWITRFEPLDLLFPPDPGGLRLLAALRATLAGVVTFFMVMLLGTVTAVQVSDRVLGFAIALYITVSVRESSPRRQFATMALAPFAAFATTMLTSLLLEQPLAAALAAPPLMFILAYGAARGPRYAALGTVALIAYIIGLVAHQPPDTLPIRFFVLLLAASNAALIRGVLLPERPQAELNRLRRAIHAGLARVLGAIAAALAAGGWTGPARAALRRDVDRLGEMIMLAQARLAALAAELPGQGGIWLHLLEVELAVEHVARVALADLATPADRVPLIATLEALQKGSQAPPHQSAAGLAKALALLVQVLREVPRAAPQPAAPPPSPANTASSLRPAFQTLIATGLAIVGGELVSPHRWYWAAFTAYVMFQGTRSRGESIGKGVQFMIGTLAGVVLGMLAATLLSGHEILTLAAIIAAVFLAFQANGPAYGVMVFWITIILGLMFGMLGYFPPDLLMLRLAEAAVGAACGALVASLVLVREERAAIQDATIAFLRALGLLVDAAAHTLLDGTPQPDLPARIMAAEADFRDLTSAAQAEYTGLPAGADEGLRRRMLLIGACDGWARELGEISLQSAEPVDPALSGALRRVVSRIDMRLVGLINRSSAGVEVPPDASETAESLVHVAPDERSREVVFLVLRIDAALARLARF